MDFKTKLMEHFRLDNNTYSRLICPLKDITFSEDEFYNIKEVTSFIKEAISKNDKIMIYGDYDVDGIMSTSIIYNTLYKLGVKQIGYYIPSRIIDGYGITLERAMQIASKEYNLVILVDNGVKQNLAIDYLMSHNIKVIIIDHHIYDDTLPNCSFLLHPHNKEIKEDLCASYMCFILSMKLLQKIDYDLLSYASLATISDMMPLSNLRNRNILRLALKYLEKHPEHIFHQLLSGKLNEESFGYYIAPKINAYGRIKEDITINRVVKIFIDTPLHIKTSLINELEDINNFRKEELKKATDEVILYNEEGIIVIKKDLRDGLIGLLAARYLNTYHKPTIALNLKDGIYKGSARSLKNTSIVDFINENKKLFLTAGGHALAGGMSFKEEDFDELKNNFFGFIKNHPFEEEKEEYIEITKDDVTLDNYLILETFAPFGMDFKEPKFVINLKKEDIIKFNRHIKSILNSEASLIGFNIDYDSLQENLKLCGKIKLDTYHKNKVQFIIDKIL